MSKELTREELQAKLEEAEKAREEAEAKVAAAEAKVTEAEAKAAEAESKAAEAESKAAEAESKAAEAELAGSKANEDGPDELTRRIIANEKERAAAKRTLFIPEDLEPDSPNTWDCEINGKRYLVPKGKDVEVPLPVYEMYTAQVAAERKARAELRKAQNKADASNATEA